MVPPDVADYVLNRKRKELATLEEKRRLTITIAADPGLLPGDSKIFAEKADAV
jgi:Ribonuclease G/E